MTRFSPSVLELLPAPDPVSVFRRISRLPHALFLDSALRDAKLGRFSFVTADPFDYFELPADKTDGLTFLKQKLAGFESATDPALPPFQGGAAGLLGYELARSLEKIPSTQFDEFETPAIAIGLFDVVVAFDHLQNRCWLISQGLPETDPEQRRRRADERLAQWRRWIQSDEPLAELASNVEGRSANKQPPPLPDVAQESLAPQFRVPGPNGLTSNFSAENYRRAVERAVEYIRAGDIFQVNLAQRLLFPAADDSVSLYLRLRERNPATFAGYFDLGNFQIVSASPERFISVIGRQVETRPIKGTRRRIPHAEADLYAGDELQQSEKDRAENVMIVDLMRNDLSRVCKAASVRVTQLCRREVYQFVQHLVSAVCGELEDDQTPLDLLRATFPGGSITGAPKVRAMEIIAELEPTARGPYCGSLGYLGFDGTLDLSILIRTITAGRGWWQMPVGGGIVVGSDPRLEYEETWHKAAGLIRSLKP